MVAATAVVCGESFNIMFKKNIFQICTEINKSKDKNVDSMVELDSQQEGDVVNLPHTLF